MQVPQLLRKKSDDFSTSFFTEKVQIGGTARLDRLGFIDLIHHRVVGFDRGQFHAFVIQGPDHPAPGIMRRKRE
jgi:hypothetical protein